jgi:peptidoglycan/xylan/chitin deacetylase (PgdA/CDA1 family)
MAKPFGTLSRLNSGIAGIWSRWEKVSVNDKAKPARESAVSTWREALSSGIYHSGVLAALRGAARRWELRPANGNFRWPRTAGPRFAILCYHRVGVEGVPLYSKLQPQVFDAQMRYLRQHYRVVSLADLLREVESPTSSAPTVAVTFDDGYRGVFEHAFPILCKYEIPATIFAIAESIETGAAPWYDRIFLALSLHPTRILTVELNASTEFSLESPKDRLAATDAIVCWLRTQPDWRRREFCSNLAKRLPVPEEQLEKRMLTWEQLRTMQARGVVCGSHTLSHPVLSQVERESLLRELRDSRAVLEQQLGRPVTDFAFPFGKPGDCAFCLSVEQSISASRRAIGSSTYIGSVAHSAGDCRFGKKRGVERARLHRPFDYSGFRSSCFSKPLFRGADVDLGGLLQPAPVHLGRSVYIPRGDGTGRSNTGWNIVYKAQKS